MENQFPKRPKLSESLPNRRIQNKHELCLNFQRSSCDYVDRCCFTHAITVINDDKNPRCSEKTKLCWKFMNGAKCQFGDTCHFIHAAKPERMNAAISISNVDENGVMQQRKQYPWRTKLCNRWMWTGSCKYGHTCSFAHGESELHNQGLNGAQGYAERGPFKLVDKKAEGKQLKVKWKNNEMISGVYADWIGDIPLVFHTI